MRFIVPFFSLVGLLTVLACSNTTRSGSALEVCEEEGCACGDDGSCPEGFACKSYDPDCQPLETPECVLLEKQDCNGVGPAACTCNGSTVPSACVEFGDGYVTEPETCASGTFACGATTCREGLDACVETVTQDGSTFVCWDAREHGCAYGVPDCWCLDYPNPGGTCTLDAEGTKLVISE